MEISNNIIITHIKLQSNISIIDEFRSAILKLMRTIPPADWDDYALQISIVTNPKMIKRILAVFSEVTQNTMQSQARYEKYLSRMAVPIYGNWYSIVSSDQTNENDIFFVIKPEKVIA